MTSREEILTTKYLHESFLYKEGKLYWRERPSSHFSKEWYRKVFNSRQSYTEAGTPNKKGYSMVRVSAIPIGVHRIIFLMHNGFLPGFVDHIDGNPSNNQISNLRSATHSQNLQNMKTPSHNTSGQKGVSFHATNGKWTAHIKINGKLKHLGSFSDFLDATKARKSAEARYFGEFSNAR
jgi:hypothetical protein